MLSPSRPEKAFHSETKSRDTSVTVETIANDHRRQERNNRKQR